jgi:hypothetical protein
LDITSYCRRTEILAIALRKIRKVQNMNYLVEADASYISARCGINFCNVNCNILVNCPENSCVGNCPKASNCGNNV